MDIGLLILRIVVGLYLFGHGSQKLLGWFGGPGLGGTEGFIGMLRFRPGWAWARAVALAETVGGILLTLGFLSPLGSFAIAAPMITATFAVHWRKGLWNTAGGVELPVTNLAAATALALTGPGSYSLDTFFGISLPEPGVAVAAAVLLVIGLVAAFAGRNTLAAGAQEAQRA